MKQNLKSFIIYTVLIVAFLSGKSQVAKTNRVWQNWVNLWNGDYTKGTLISPKFRLHAAMLDGTSDTSITNPETLIQWIKQIRTSLHDMKFSTQVGPLVSGYYLVGRWIATGVYKGDIPGAKVSHGTIITFTGTDILRLKDGKIAEYWINSDMQSMLSQLKVY